FTVRTPSVPDTAALLDALNSVAGFSDASVQTVAFTQSQGGGASYYSVSGSATVTSAGLSHRFTEGTN
ncbi:MAG: fimbrial assembly protein, partial [Cellulomonas sp.]|nr:fimbrial assembly protein [Cellulomonas sp.]